MLMQTQISLFQGLRQYSQTKKGIGNRSFYVGANHQDSDNNQNNAGQTGERNRQSNLAYRRRHGDSGKNQAVDLAIGICCGDIGAKMLFP